MKKYWNLKNIYIEMMLRVMSINFIHIGIILLLASSPLASGRHPEKSGQVVTPIINNRKGIRVYIFAKSLGSMPNCS